MPRNLSVDAGQTAGQVRTTTFSHAWVMPTALEVEALLDALLDDVADPFVDAPR